MEKELKEFIESIQEDIIQIQQEQLPLEDYYIFSEEINKFLKELENENSHNA